MAVFYTALLKVLRQQQAVPVRPHRNRGVIRASEPEEAPKGGTPPPYRSPGHEPARVKIGQDGLRCVTLSSLFSKVRICLAIISLFSCDALSPPIFCFCSNTLAWVAAICLSSSWIFRRSCEKTTKKRASALYTT